MRFWHGTSRDNIGTILKTGLKPSSGVVTGTMGVYLAGTVEGAAYWAKHAYLEGDDVGRFSRRCPDAADCIAILEVDLPDRLLVNLRADMEQYEDFEDEIDEPFDEDDWQASLKWIGDVMYAGKIPAKFLRRLPDDVVRRAAAKR